LREPEDVQNEHDPAVTHDGGAREHRQALERIRKRLDDDLFRIEDALDQEAEPLAVALEHHNGGSRAGAIALALGRKPKSGREIHERQELSAQPIDRRAVDPFDAAVPRTLEPNQLEEARLRDGEALAAGRYDERRDDGQGERDLDTNRRSRPEGRAQIDRSA